MIQSVVDGDYDEAEGRDRIVTLVFEEGRIPLELKALKSAGEPRAHAGTRGTPEVRRYPPHTAEWPPPRWDQDQV